MKIFDNDPTQDEMVGPLLSYWKEQCVAPGISLCVCEMGVSDTVPHYLLGHVNPQSYRFCLCLVGVFSPISGSLTLFWAV